MKPVHVGSIGAGYDFRNSKSHGKDAALSGAQHRPNQPLRYRLNADGSFLLYSVGENLTDDGGDTSLLPDPTAVRNLWAKKDYIWPAPATPEEVEAYRTEALKK